MSNAFVIVLLVLLIVSNFHNLFFKSKYHALHRLPVLDIIHTKICQTLVLVKETNGSDVIPNVSLALFYLVRLACSQIPDK